MIVALFIQIAACDKTCSLNLAFLCFRLVKEEKKTNMAEVSRIAKKLASFVTEEMVANVKSRYGDIGEDLLAFAVALEVGLPALATLQVAQASAKKKESDDLREVIRQQAGRLREYANNSFLYGAAEVQESTRIEDSSSLHVNGGLADETIADLEIFSDGD
jgi:hypothetical protein